MRNVSEVIQATETYEGDGFLVHRPFPTHELSFLDPFLLLDHMGPMDVSPGEAKGAPDHPHRGFETVTYLLKGAMEHKDSAGNHGVINPGDVQWMTAGSGVVHSEMPSAEFQAAGGRMEGFQLWVNLPAVDKMMAPRYQDVRADEIPVVESGGVLVRVVAGEYSGVSGPANTHSPVNYLHATLQPGGTLSMNIPSQHNLGVYVVSGSAEVNGVSVSDFQLAVLDHEGDELEVLVPQDASGPTDVLILSGQPLNEPVARYGPFVMNTKEEIVQAFDDFQSGRMGAIA